MKKSIFIEWVCFAFIVLFVYAAASKLMDYQKFRVQLGQSPLLTSFAGTVAWIIPGAEIIIAGMLATAQTRKYGLYAFFTLMTMFSAYIVSITRFSSYIPCSCGGILQRMTWDQHLIFNLFFLLLAGFAIYFYQDRKTALS